MFSQVIETIKAAKHLTISAHTNPDGDAIGAMVAMGQICALMDKPYTILLEEPIKKLSYLIETCNWATSLEQSVDTFIALDCGDVDRLVGYKAYFKDAHTTINIDHHMTNTFYGAYNIVEKEASSTCEVVYQLVCALGLEINVPLGQALYTGLVTDTGGFMHNCTAPSTHLAAAKLIELDFDAPAIYRKLIHEKSLATVKLQGMAVSHLECLDEKGIYLATLSQDELVKSGATKEDVDGVVSYLKNIEGIEVMAFIYPKGESSYKLSMRANPPYDVASFCAQFGGGGHILAAGATIDGTLEGAAHLVKDKLKEMMNS
ncbi:DHH family phosphoesterase [Niameybacter massiliensis]|uniref:DHH family phosphoesterase n=1 Tax=Niameybacter massiliensis TaxID=1658108 RepID=UPI0006B48223|nr:bifunctional oligoribonuclease/PAP phosphatase NrnA [Niameybacter massiliensis]